MSNKKQDLKKEFDELINEVSISIENGNTPIHSSFLKIENILLRAEVQSLREKFKVMKSAIVEFKQKEDLRGLLKAKHHLATLTNDDVDELHNIAHQQTK